MDLLKLPDWKAAQKSVGIRGIDLLTFRAHSFGDVGMITVSVLKLGVGQANRCSASSDV